LEENSDTLNELVVPYTLLCGNVSRGIQGKEKLESETLETQRIVVRLLAGNEAGVWTGVVLP